LSIQLKLAVKKLVPQLFYADYIQLIINIVLNLKHTWKK